ncbi:hypothetical protein [Nocardia xishanensis]
MTMRPEDSLLSHATGSFLTMPGGTPPDEAKATLGRHRFVVIIEGETVSSVLTADAVAAAVVAGLPTIGALDAPPCVVVKDQTTFAEYCDTLAVTLLDLGPDQVVLLNERDQVSGVLPASVIQQYLGSGGHTPEPSEMGPHGSTDDQTAHGPSRLPLARVLCREPGCGVINTLAFYDPKRPPRCQNRSSEHTLRIGT